MEFAVSEKMQTILGMIREFMDNEVFPMERDLMHKDVGTVLRDAKAARQKVKQMGLWLPQISAEHGGLGLSLMEHGMVSEALGRSPLGHYLFNCQAPDAGNMEILIHYGSPAQKAKWLKPLLDGDIRSCFGMTEPEVAGSNPTWLLTRAEKDGDHYVIRGHKWFTTGAEGSAICIVMAVTNPDAGPYERASMFIVPTDTPGFDIVRNISVMGEKGHDYATHAEVMLNGARVPKENLLGAKGAGFLIAQERLGPGRIHHCMRWIGICERSFDLMCKRAAERELAPGKVLGGRQIVQTWIAECRAEINAARLMVLQAAWKIDNVGLYEAREEISLIKFYVAEVMLKTIDRALQVHGALGMTDDTPLAWFYRHERAARIYDGADEVHKDVVAKRILRKYGANLKY